METMEVKLAQVRALVEKRRCEAGELRQQNAVQEHRLQALEAMLKTKLVPIRAQHEAESRHLELEIIKVDMEVEAARAERKKREEALAALVDVTDKKERQKKMLEEMIQSLRLLREEIQSEMLRDIEELKTDNYLQKPDTREQGMKSRLATLDRLIEAAKKRNESIRSRIGSMKGRKHGQETKHQSKVTHQWREMKSDRKSSKSLAEGKRVVAANLEERVDAILRELDDMSKR